MSQQKPLAWTERNLAKFVDIVNADWPDTTRAERMIARHKAFASMLKMTLMLKAALNRSKPRRPKR